MQLVKKNVALLDPYVPGYQPGREEKVVKLNTNENPYPPSPAVGRCLEGLNPADLRLYPDPSARALRKTLARVYGVDAANVFCGNGSDELIALVFRTFLEPDDIVLFPYPSYSVYRAQAELHGIRCKAVETAADFQVRPDDYLRYPGKVILLANPNPPAGTLLPLSELDGLAAVFPGLLVVDEAYIDFGGESALSLIGPRPNLLVLRTFSKSFSLCGLRVGYAFGDAGLIRALDKTKDSYNLNSLSQILAIAAVEDYAYMRENAQRIVAGREYLREQLASLGFDTPASYGNFILVEHGVLAAPLIYRELARRRIFVRHFNERRLAGKLRISVGTPEEMAELVSALQEILADNGGR
ncbi:MAG: histidinol-phosphate transaminase [Peptococcaceae bacterium]|nr:histidinol-phosphate transaminase [Peptococcaceae bacterium]